MPSLTTLSLSELENLSLEELENLSLMPDPNQEQVFSAAGDHQWESPITGTAIIECIGGGGSGGTTVAGSRAGGGGGAYARKEVAVTQGISYDLRVGAGGSLSGDTAGGDSWFDDDTTVLAKAGILENSATGGGGGSAAASIGDVVFSGGDGGARAPTASDGGGGGGGGSGQSDADGGDGAQGSTAEGTGGDGGTGTGNGGDGGDVSTAGQNGNAPGGGGGGKGSGGSGFTSGDGAVGQVKISWYEEPAPPPTAICVTETNTLGSHQITNISGSDRTVQVTETEFQAAFVGTVTLGSKTNQEIADEIAALGDGDIFTAAVTDAYSPSATNTLKDWAGTTIPADGGTTQLPGDEECPSVPVPSASDTTSRYQPLQSFSMPLSQGI